MTINIAKKYTTTKDRLEVRNLGIVSKGVIGEYHHQNGDWRTVLWDAEGRNGIRVRMDGGTITSVLSANRKRLKVSDLLEVPVAAPAPVRSNDAKTAETIEDCATTHTFDLGNGTTIIINVYNK